MTRRARIVEDPEPEVLNIGECGTIGTRPADCKLDHPCCAIHARENPNEPCIACRAGRQTRNRENYYAQREREKRRKRETTWKDQSRGHAGRGGRSRT